ncbi:hypothetical protein K402DRAFT_298444, partial [Aulographum hederae CBS 113979]
LTSNDWTVIAQYMGVLKPIMIASKRAEGSPKNGRNGMLWEVLPIYESLLEHLETKVNDHEADVDQTDSRAAYIDAFQHFKIDIRLGWQKLRLY